MRICVHVDVSFVRRETTLTIRHCRHSFFLNHLKTVGNIPPALERRGNPSDFFLKAGNDLGAGSFFSASDIFSPLNSSCIKVSTFVCVRACVCACVCVCICTYGIQCSEQSASVVCVWIVSCIIIDGYNIFEKDILIPIPLALFGGESIHKSEIISTVHKTYKILENVV